jgi:hypothetical protein
VTHLDAGDVGDLYWAGRTCLLSRHSDFPVYERVFRRYFLGAGEEEEPPLLTRASALPDLSLLPDVPVAVPLVRDAAEKGQTTGLVASSCEVLRRKRFSEYTPEELLALRDLMSRLELTTPERRVRPDAVRLLGSVQDPPCGGVLLRHAPRTDHGRPPPPRPRPRSEPGRRGGGGLGGWHSHRGLAAGIRAALRQAGLLPRSCGGHVLGRPRAGGPRPPGRPDGRVARLAHRVVWVNPLKGDPMYQPLARGMRAALPFLDVFMSGHNLSSLEALASCYPPWTDSGAGHPVRPAVRSPRLEAVPSRRSAGSGTWRTRH